MTLIKASAQVMAVTPNIGVRADRIETVLSMSKLGEVKITDNVVDQAAVKAALEAVIKQFQEWKAESTPPKFGAAPGSDSPPPGKAMSLSDAIAEHYRK